MYAKCNNKLKILVAPLDWGLGHTTRCFPIINELLQKGVQVLLAGNDVQRIVLQQAFPHCKYITLQGYNIRYAKNKQALLWHMIRQVPGIFSAIHQEQLWLQKIIATEKLDGIISDNRYGLYSSAIPCAFITHQLYIKTPLGPTAERMLQRMNYSKIKKYTCCWIPDYATAPTLAGALSHPAKMPETHCEYIGPLSRMQHLPGEKKSNHLLIIISGPEPQRTIFENLIFEQLPDYKGTATVVRGLPGSGVQRSEWPHVTLHAHLNTAQLNAEMSKAAWIICRSGYSSVMDISAVRAKSILVPTPGQTEQEYMATYLARQQWCLTQPQAAFNLHTMIQKAEKCTCLWPQPAGQQQQLSQAVEKFIQQCTTPLLSP